MRTVPPWHGKTDNSPIPDRVRLRVFDHANGVCEKCGRKLYPGKWDVDHKLALILGGSHSEDNFQALCSVPCHSDKTKTDSAEKSRTYRKRKKNYGLKKKSSFRGWRRFDGTIVKR